MYLDMQAHSAWYLLACNAIIILMVISSMLCYSRSYWKKYAKLMEEKWRKESYLKVFKLEE